MFSWLGTDDRRKKDPEVFQTVSEGLKKLYKTKLLPLEESYKFHEFHSPALEDADFDNKPMVLLVGQYSTGKTSFIRWEENNKTICTYWATGLREGFIKAYDLQYAWNCCVSWWETLTLGCFWGSVSHTPVETHAHVCTQGGRAQQVIGRWGLWRSERMLLATSCFRTCTHPCCLILFLLILTRALLGLASFIFSISCHWGK